MINYVWVIEGLLYNALLAAGSFTMQYIPLLRACTLMSPPWRRFSVVFPAVSDFPELL